MVSRINTSSQISHSIDLLEDKFRALEPPEEFEDKSVETRQRSSSTDSVGVYLREIGRIAMLTREEEVTEARKVQRYVQLLEQQRDKPFSAEEEQIVAAGKRAKAHMI